MESSAKAMNIDLIVKELFNFLPASDLLQCSKVSRLWYLFSRSKIREERICIARISDCRKLKSFLKCLHRAQNPPFNGISLVRPHTKMALKLHKCVKCSLGNLQVDKMELKYFHVDMVLGAVDCPTLIQFLRSMTKRSVHAYTRNFPIAKMLIGLKFQPEIKKLANVFLKNVESQKLPEIYVNLLSRFSLWQCFTDEDEFLKDVFLNSDLFNVVLDLIRQTLLTVWEQKYGCTALNVAMPKIGVFETTPENQFFQLGPNFISFERSS